MTLPKIKHVRAWFIGGATAEQGAGGGDYHDQGANHWIDDHIATPMSKYKQYEQSRQSFGINVLGTLIVEVEADNGQTGFAVSTAGEMGCFIVEKHLNRFIEGKCVAGWLKRRRIAAFSFFFIPRHCMAPGHSVKSRALAQSSIFMRFRKINILEQPFSPRECNGKETGPERPDRPGP